MAPAAFDNTNAGEVVSLFAPLQAGNENFVFPLLNSAGVAFYNDADEVVLSEARIGRDRRSQNERVTGNFSIRKDFDHDNLRYVEFGGMIEEAEFFTRATAETTTYRDPSFFSPTVTLGQLGVGLRPGILTEVGATLDFDQLGNGDVLAFFDNAADFVEDGIIRESVSSPIPGSETQLATETETALYFESQVDWNDFEFIGGFRFVNLDIETQFFNRPSLITDAGFQPISDEFQLVQTAEDDRTDLLPRLAINYRPTEDMVFRAGFYKTVSRPPVRSLVANTFPQLDTRLRYGPDGDQPRLRVQIGNENLKPQETGNFSLGWEWYSDNIGVLKIEGFYKAIQNSIQQVTSISGLEDIPDDIVFPNLPEFNNLPDNLFVEVTQPTNPDFEDTIWGIETSVERRFDFLPSPWDGLGVYANYTYTESERDRIVFFFDRTTFTNQQVVLTDTPFNGSPETSGTFSVTYTKYGFDANLTYSYQDRRLSSAGVNRLNDFDDEIDTLDFRIEYTMRIAEQPVRIFFEGNDILRGDDEPFVSRSLTGVGIPDYFVGANYFGGRSFSLGAAMTF